MIGERIKQLRMKKGLSQQALAKRLGTSSGYISELEQGKKMPGAELLLSLKREFDVDLNWLVASEIIMVPGNHDIPQNKLCGKVGGRVVCYNYDDLIEEVLVIMGDLPTDAKEEVARCARKERQLAELLAKEKRNNKTR
jgi:transcriptional regulator with XRE-family HTH domain